jgi:3-deoxy-7-phosphoheptulonate synthase
MRAQLFKPRTSPDSFQGLGADGLKILEDLKKNAAYSNIKFLSEVCSVDHFDILKDHVEAIQIGARNMQNFELLKYVGSNFKHEFVMLKRGFASTVDEWIEAARYLEKFGIPKEKIILCERGSRSFTSPTGVQLDFICALEAQKRGYKVLIDPSHGTKKAEYVIPLAHASLALKMDGLMIECHPEPEKSVSDAKQAISLTEIDLFLKNIKHLALSSM